MPKAGFSSLTVKDEVLDLAYELSMVTGWSIPMIVERALKFYKKQKLTELKKRAKALE